MSSSTSRLWEEESENKHSVYLGTDDLEEELTWLANWTIVDGRHATGLAGKG